MYVPLDDAEKKIRKSDASAKQWRADLGHVTLGGGDFPRGHVVNDYVLALTFDIFLLLCIIFGTTFIGRCRYRPSSLLEISGNSLLYILPMT